MRSTQKEDWRGEHLIKGIKPQPLSTREDAHGTRNKVIRAQLRSQAKKGVKQK